MRSLRRYITTAAGLALLVLGAHAHAAYTSPATDYLTRARTAAAADRHREAIAWYLRAAEEAPTTAAGLGRELGDQYTWAESPDTAITWYRRYLTEHPGDIDAHLGLARALAWSNRLGEAHDYYERLLPAAGDRETDVWLGIATVEAWQDRLWPARRVYDRILEGDPDNLDARVGRARVINWAGRHREARRLYTQLLDEYPGNADVRGGLANAHHWMGRPDRAAGVLDVTPQPASLGAIEREIRRARAPGAAYTFSHSDDSDDIERDTHTARVAFSPGWLTRTGVQYTHGTIDQPGLPGVTRDGVQATLSQRFSDALALSVNPGVERNDFDRGALGPEAFWKDGYDLFTLDAYLTLTPADWVRGDLGVFVGSIDNPVPVFRGIRVTETSAGLDWRLAPTVLTVTAASFTDYSDDNSRVSVSERVEWKPAERLPLPVAHRFTLTTGAAYFDFERTLDHGYYNPDRYVSVYEMLGVEVTFARRLRVDVSGRIAIERENSGDWFSAGSFSASATLRTVDRLSVQAGYYNSRSRLDTRAGYKANGFWVGVEY